ncbi:MAG: phosphoribosylanthranilate isomerase [Verrucomicrobiae bacterium]|nr:phosphoribosylanthranilate isomerase [Verrucomicrobiae bacterium]
MDVRIKICGITRREDAEMAVEYGADALGFIFHPLSPRFITPEEALMISLQVPVFVYKVGVFVDVSLEQVTDTAAQLGLNAIQLHGSEPPEFTTKFYQPIIKAFRMQSEDVIQEMACYQDVSAYLLDAFSSTRMGGTGKTFEWDWAIKAKLLRKPIILSGGLTVENVGVAIKHVKPYAIDVSSGVEEFPGRKDPEKLKKFITECKKASAYLM